MAVRKPIVLGAAGDYQELQSTDSIPDTSPNFITLTAGENLATGDVLYLSGVDTVKKAKADSITTMPAMGFARVAALDTDPVDVQIMGTQTGLTLVAGTEYFVSDTTAGALTSVAPTTSTYYVQRVGVAVSSTDIVLGFGAHIKRA